MNADFQKIARRLSPTLKRIAYRLNHRFTFFDQDDLYQEALIHLWLRFSLGRLGDKTDSYILQGCYFHLQNYIRTHRERVALINLEGFVNKEGEFGPKEPLFLADRSAQEHIDDFDNKALAGIILNNGLTTREKEILSFCAEGLTTREIGLRLRVSHVMVVKSMKKIRGKCGRYLDF